MGDELWAHSANEYGARHRLEDHLRGTAALARVFGDVFGASALAGYLGLTHDVGKGACGWQQGLLTAERTGGPVGVDHKCSGTWLAQQAAGPFAMCVYGHHGGLPSLAGLGKVLGAANPELKRDWETTAAQVARLLPEITAKAPEGLMPEWATKAWHDNRLAFDLLIRMVFSAVVDADFLDTEAHFRGARRPEAGASMGSLADRYDERRAKLLAGRKASPVDQWRADVYAEAVAKAVELPGMYRLAAPTGSGKTIASGGFAVRHAQAHGLRRVVVAVPFISITEQNAAEYRRLLDDPEDPVVLEHHSEAQLDGNDGTTAWWRRLAAENWDAPFVVTTTAQLFQSLFDHRPAAMRKLHRLAESVIVLDEVQALPDRLLMPILSALRVLTEHFGSTVLLASATQPSYWSLRPFSDLNVNNVIAAPEPLYEQFRRVRYEWKVNPAPSLADIAAEVACERQALVVVNTTADSAATHRLIQAQRPASLGNCLHLSTRMTAQHRREVLDEARRLLDDHQPVVVISTQLIEAGVDVDFPVVYRAWAPADSLQQAAGRANRNARLPAGRVVVFQPTDGGQPGDASYKAALAATEAHFGPGRADPDSIAELDRYYPKRYALQNLEQVGPGAEIEKLQRELDFPAVAEKFRLIEETTVPVAVRFAKTREELDHFDKIVTQLRGGSPQVAGIARHLLRELRPFLATIPKRLARQAQDHGWTEPIVGDLHEWKLPYHDARGIDTAELPDLNTMKVEIW